VVGVFRLVLEFGGRKTVNRVPLTIVFIEVDLRAPETVDVSAFPATKIRRKGEVSQHVVKGTVLQHDHDDVVDCLKTPNRRIVRGGHGDVRRGRDRCRDQIDDGSPLRGQERASERAQNRPPKVA